MRRVRQPPPRETLGRRAVLDCSACPFTLMFMPAQAPKSLPCPVCQAPMLRTQDIIIRPASEPTDSKN